MASRVKEMSREEAMQEKERPVTPPIDLSDAAVKELIRSAKERGYVTLDQINSALPSPEANSKQINNILSLFGEIGINLVRTKEAEPEEEPATSEESEADDDSENELVEVQQRPVLAKSVGKPLSVPTTPCACTSAK